MVSDEGDLRVPLAEDSESDHLSWWGDSDKHTARPWYDPPKKKKTVPSEQTEALQSTRKVCSNSCCLFLKSLLSNIVQLINKLN